MAEKRKQEEKDTVNRLKRREAAKTGMDAPRPEGASGRPAETTRDNTGKPMQQTQKPNGGVLQQGNSAQNAGAQMTNGIPAMEQQKALSPGQIRIMEAERQREPEGVSETAEMPSGFSVLELPRKEPIGKKEVEAAQATLQEYKRGKANLERRIVENEQWYKMRHWDQIRERKHADTDPYPASAWLFNSIANKHADAMDNFPEPNVLPREEGDKQEAKVLSSILPVILEQNQFEETYSDAWWYKLKTGTGVYGVFWNSKKHGGLGDIDIRKLDLLNIFWEPGIHDLQQSRNLFTVDLMDNDLLKEAYPQLRNLGGSTIDITKYVYDDTVDTSKKSAVVDWYYKKAIHEKEVLHYCKFCNGEVLYASENDPNYAERGFYDHGSYPIVFDVLFMEEGTPAGFGYIDTMKDVQMYIDKLNQIIIKNALMASKKRYFIRDDGSINEKEFADWDKDFIHVSGGGLGDDSIREMQTVPLSNIYVQILQLKIDELKETSGNRDVSQGGTTSGVTAASAIAALQEAGSKLSRDMIKSAYRAFARINYLCLELIRQFYDEPRFFRILGDKGGQEFVSYDNSGLRPQAQGTAFGLDLGYRVPEFDIRITSQKSSPFSKISQNELAKELYGMGFFNPELSDQALVCVDMMDFEGKDAVMQKISQNGTLLKMVQQMQVQMAKMAAIIDQNYGTNALQMVAGNGPVEMEKAPAGEERAGYVDTNSLGSARRTSESSVTQSARRRVAEASSPE